ncbi:MAG: hypothetical protein EOS12_27120 [Mesorhizobium sp.]|nr:MAG: hypothetical protein EOS12_27120 [Mesorhizobium sp.]
MTNITAGAETAALSLSLTNAGSGLSTGYNWTPTNHYPSANDGAALGVAGTAWSDLFLASGAVTNWNNGDVLLTHSANTLAYTGASSGYTFDALVQATQFNVGANKILGARDTSWGAMTGTPDKATAFATGTVTLAQLAGRVMAMQTALTTHGILGA